MKLSGLEEDIPIVWEYVRSKVAPFIRECFSAEYRIPAV